MNKNNENKQSPNSNDLAQNVMEEKRNEDGPDKSATVTYESHEDNNVAHLERLRTAMKIIEEEIGHIELRSKNIK